MTKVYYESDADIGVLRDRKVAVIGYGNQGRAQALNLRDSGVTPLIGVRKDDTRQRAEEDGFATVEVADAAAACDVLLILIPDEVTPAVFEEAIRPHLNAGDVVSFATGYNVAFGLLTPPDNVDVVMVAPRMIGEGVRDTYVEGGGFPSFIGVHQDASGNALAVCLAIAQGIGTTRSGALELHSNTSQYGSMTRDMRFIFPEMHEKLGEVLKEITSGDFAREWTAEQEAGHPMLTQLREMRTMHPIAGWERKTRDAFRMDAPGD